MFVPSGQAAPSSMRLYSFAVHSQPFSDIRANSSGSQPSMPGADFPPFVKAVCTISPVMAAASCGSILKMYFAYLVMNFFVVSSWLTALPA